MVEIISVLVFLCVAVPAFYICFSRFMRMLYGREEEYSTYIEGASRRKNIPYISYGRFRKFFLANVTAWSLDDYGIVRHKENKSVIFALKFRDFIKTKQMFQEVNRIEKEIDVFSALSYEINADVRHTEAEKQEAIDNMKKVLKFTGEWRD